MACDHTNGPGEDNAEAMAKRDQPHDLSKDNQRTHLKYHHLLDRGGTKSLRIHSPPVLPKRA